MVYHPGIVKGKLDDVIVRRLRTRTETEFVWYFSLGAVERTHRKYVETGVKVEQHGDIPVARRLFFGELNLGDSLTGNDCEQTLPTASSTFTLLTQWTGTSH